MVNGLSYRLQSPTYLIPMTKDTYSATLTEGSSLLSSVTEVIEKRLRKMEK